MSFSTRRTFMKASGALAAAACASVDQLAAKPRTMPIGLELYSVRSLAPKDLDGTMAQVRAAGYTVVEAAGFYDRTAPDFRKAMDKAGLRCISAHYTLALLRTQLDQLIDYAHGVGLEYMICSSSGGQHRDPAAKGAPTLDDWHWIADQFNSVGEKVKAAGITFGVHNHIPEFQVYDGITTYDELLRLTDPRFVVFQMDVGWVSAAGRDPLEYLRKTPERFPLMHVKDVARGADGKFHSAVLGSGKMDYAPIMRAATGLKQYFIEQEEFEMDPMEELRIEAEYMRKLNVRAAV
jgi:sugar phosphate isomerase/epimerase